MDPGGPGRTRVDPGGIGQTRAYPGGSGRTQADSGGPGWTRMDLDGPGWTQTVQESSGLVKIRLLILYSESYTIIGDFCPKPFGLFFFEFFVTNFTFVYFSLFVNRNLISSKFH